ncbi:hypothetical protein RB195_014647 [Necator americanus]|uniref:Phlebovirus glycoprotein G2 fusion domain-containing protein n=1 Tax=Necator americanus TaxID=51031 RepID=A0ABR1E2A6_NECAM
MGSCVENKCAEIKASSLIPELSIGNNYPGTTRCLESCGGPRCDCFYLSSSCLFYRIYAVPTDNDVYELFTCSPWQERVKAKVQIKRPTGETFTTYMLGLRRNVPVQLASMDVTLSVLSWPYLSILDTKFISNAHTTSLWTSEALPHLQCPSLEAAQSLQCNLIDSCQCDPAENQVKCHCQDQDINKNFRKIGNVLPITFPFLKITEYYSNVMAQINQGISVDIIINIKETIEDTIVDITDEICEVDNTFIYGCYRCNRGASANVTCSSSSITVYAEIECDVDTFTIPRSPHKEQSTLRFLLPNARVHLNCSIMCGSTTKYFDITGILKYTHTLQTRLKEISMHTQNVTSDFEWPDAGHIVDVYWQWYKTVLLTVLIVGLALLISYLYLTTACGRLLCKISATLIRIACNAIKLLIYIACFSCKHVFSTKRCSSSQQNIATKTL